MSQVEINKECPRCSVEFFKKHLEIQFKDGMSWDNYGFGIGKWNIDHIKALVHFDLKEKNQILIACNYCNLQPLWHADNLRKGTKTNE